MMTGYRLGWSSLSLSLALHLGSVMTLALHLSSVMTLPWNVDRVGWWKWVFEARIVVVDNVTTEAIRVTYTASRREASCD